MPATKHCCYGLCRSDSRYTDRPHMKGITWVRFVKPHHDLEKCRRWVSACGRANFTVDNVKKDTYICSKHFDSKVGPDVEHPDPIPAHAPPEQHTCRDKTSVTNSTGKDSKIPEEFCVKKEDPDPSETWLDMKEESVEYSALADNVCEYKFSSSLVPPIKQEIGDGSISDSLSKTSVCKKTWSGISREAYNCNDYKRNLKMEKDQYLSKDCIEIKEEITNYNDPSCDTCDVESPASVVQPLPEVISDHLQDALTEGKWGPNICEICNKAFSQRSKLVVHMRIHTKERPYTCDVCNKNFAHKGNLVTHVRIHTKEKPYVCKICTKTFTQSSNLVAHIRIHTKEKPFICDVCNKAFTQGSSLKSHMNVHLKESLELMAHMKGHSKEKPFTCVVCKMSFSHKGNLKSHIQVHTKENQYTCYLCNKGYAQRSKYVEHIRMHTNERPYICVVCNKAFARKSVLKVHTKIHTRKKPIKCDSHNFLSSDQIDQSPTDLTKMIPKATN